MHLGRGTLAHTTVEHRRAVLAAIARREWLLQMLALGAAGCGRGDQTAARASTVTIACRGISVFDPDERDSHALIFLPLVTPDARGDLEGRSSRRGAHCLHGRDGGPQRGLGAQELPARSGEVTGFTLTWGTPWRLARTRVDVTPQRRSRNEPSERPPHQRFQPAARAVCSRRMECAAASDEIVDRPLQEGNAAWAVFLATRWSP